MIIKKKIRPIITIDGPAASGKGTISKKIAKELNLFYLETGIFYRIIGKEFIEATQKKDIKKFIAGLNESTFKVNPRYKKSLYTEKVAFQASKLATLDVVRSYVLSQQIQALKNYSKAFKGIILEGRDCGTVIAPKADVKVFLYASLEVRARRRYDQLSSKKTRQTYENILKDLAARDKSDISRNLSPLVKAKDANEIDCSYSTVEETINIVKKFILSKLPNFK